MRNVCLAGWPKKKKIISGMPQVSKQMGHKTEIVTPEVHGQ